MQGRGAAGDILPQATHNGGYRADGSELDYPSLQEVGARLGWPVERVCREARAPLLAESSVKKALDLDWSDPAQKASAVKSLAMQLARH